MINIQSERLPIQLCLTFLHQQHLPQSHYGEPVEKIL